MANQPGNFLDFLFSDPLGVGAALFGPSQPLRGGTTPTGTVPQTTQQRTEASSLQGLQPLDLQVDSPTGRTPPVQPGAPIPFGTLTAPQQASFSDPRFLPVSPDQFSANPATGLTERAAPPAPPPFFGGGMFGDGAGAGGGPIFTPDESVFLASDAAPDFGAGAPTPNVVFQDEGTPAPPLEFAFDRGQQFDRFSPIYGLLTGFQDLFGEFSDDISEADFFAFLGVDPFTGGGVPAFAEALIGNQAQFFPDAATLIRSLTEAARVGLTELVALGGSSGPPTVDPLPAAQPVPAFDQDTFIQQLRDDFNLDDLFRDLEQLQQLPEELTPPGLLELDPAFREENRGAGFVGL